MTTGSTSAVDTVVKLGGGLLAHPADFDAVFGVIAAAAAESRLLIVPGGGPFANAVRVVDRRLHLTDDAAHWMAVLGMDQYAHLVASKVHGGVVVATRGEIVEALHAGRLPVLAPFRWLREADPLPHSWDVTSDSIAAWVARQVGARRLVLVKPPGAGGAPRVGRATTDEETAPGVVARGLVDAYFPHSLPEATASRAIGADQIAALKSALQPRGTS